MKKIGILIVLFFWSFSVVAQTSQKDSLALREIYTQALVKGKSYDWLHHICYQIGPRLSGSANLEKMVTYTAKELETLGAKVWLQPVKVPHWERGAKEKAYIQTSDGNRIEVPVLALGGSVATPPNGIQGNVVEFKSLDALQKADAQQVQGKIVFLNGAMPADFINTFEAYSQCGSQRFSGARIAAKKGALAVIVRSLGTKQDDIPHTGTMGYGNLPDHQRIPAAAISTNGANLLSSLIAKDPTTAFYLKQNCKTFPDADSYNVIAEIKGSEYPDEIIAVGGHLDSWDVGQGAHDDGAGVVQSMEVIRILKAMNYQPKRTIRVVLFTNEENGVRGGHQYAEVSKEKGEHHIMALESDSGGFVPRGFTLMGTAAQRAKVKSWKSLFEPYYIHYFKEGYPGTDIHPLEYEQTLLIGLFPDPQRYFDYHHTANDVFEAVNERELALGAGTMTSIVYLVDQYGL